MPEQLKTRFEVSEILRRTIWVAVNSYLRLNCRLSDDVPLQLYPMHEALEKECERLAPFAYGYESFFENSDNGFIAHDILEKVMQSITALINPEKDTILISRTKSQRETKKNFLALLNERAKKNEPVRPIFSPEELEEMRHEYIQAAEDFIEADEIQEAYRQNRRSLEEDMANLFRIPPELL